jgi:phage terminase Nu1 subunit (DNA packaging protein)
MKKATKARSIADTNINAADLGKVLGISRASIANLATDGILPRAARGEFNLAACVQAYIQHKRTLAGSDKVGNLTVERSRLAKARADKAERDERVEKGELVPASDIEQAWLATAGLIRTRILGVPRKIAPRIIALKTATEAETLMGKELNVVLAALAETPKH